MRLTFLALGLSLAAVAGAGSGAGEQRIEKLLKKMTLEEKARMTSGLDGMNSQAVARLKIPALRMTDGPNGVRWDKTTAFPTGIALAANWDAPMALAMGRALGREARGRGRDVLLGPCVNINRHPFGGRNFESYGEDPWLASRVAVAWVSGLQAQGVGASTKHFAANNQETLRDRIDTRVEERALREIYWPVFEAAVKEAGTLTVMAAYNRLNGEFCSANDLLLNQVLKKEWGFEGLVVSDWGATHAGAEAAAAGLDLEMPGPGEFMGAKLAVAVKNGSLKEAVLDGQVRRILRVMLRLGLLDQVPGEKPALVNSPENQACARAVAEGGAVLLKNEAGALPLDLAKIKRLAVVGPGAAVARTGGGGSSQISPPYAVSPLEGLRARLKGKVDILYAQGAARSDDVEAMPASALKNVQAEYFANTELKGAPTLKRAETQVDFDWGQASPGAGLPVDKFSVRYSGSFVAPKSGEISLGCRGDDGYRLKVNGKTVIENWSDHAAETRLARMKVEEGKSYPFELEYYENEGGAALTLGWRVDKDYVAEAIAAAKAADAVVVFVGLSDQFESEGMDRKDFSLPGGQNDLILSMAAANKRVIVVNESGSPVNVEPWIASVGALLQAWFPGMEGGNALAALLVGDKNPSGKLPVTFPKRLEDVPSFANFPGDSKTVSYKEGLFVGYRHYDSRQVEPRFEFGKGLSYTTFEYSGLSLARKGSVAVASFTLKNSGNREGAEVAQLYVRPPKSALPRPMQELKAFEKVALKPGESRAVSLVLNERSFQYWNPAKHAWVADAGSYGIQIGSSSRDLRLKGDWELK
jgi:beta-glucosidase